MTNSEERYLYTIYPKKPIKNLNESLPLIRVSRSLFLNKEEVLKCFECGSVYRRFSNDGIVEKFNKYEIDRVHRPNYISREDWAKIQKNTETDTLVVNGVAAAEEPQPEKQEEKVEEVKEEIINEEVAPVEEDTQENDSNEVIEENIEYVEAPEPTDVLTTGNIEFVEEDPQPLPESVTEAFTEEVVEAPYDEEEDEIIEDTEVVDEEETTEEVSGEIQARPVVNVNYNKKKKHHH